MTRRGRGVVVDMLRDRIVSGLHVGRYKGGERLPSVSELAREFQVNERVILAALKTLATDGFVEVRPRSGAYVAHPHPASGEGLPDLGSWVVETLLQGRSRGLKPREVGDYIQRCLTTRRLRAACIECNADQVHLLCSELTGDLGFTTESCDIDELRGSAIPDSIRRADVLVTTVFHAPEVRSIAERLGKPWRAVTLRADIMEDVMRRLREGPVYYVATDPRFEPKLRKMLGPRARLKNLHVMITDRDDLNSIPPAAPTFVMTSARARVTEQFGERGGPGTHFHPPRQLSDDAARDILRFIVRANLASIAAGLE
jgi:DNA-binding transcriptional regulator YhcF (GntR family)